MSVFSGGHVLLDDLPGSGKTTLIKALSAAMGCSFGRIQFTPDLLPSDILGMTVFNQKTGDFQLRKGPVFTHLLLADEINRAIPRTQSALLEAMEERQATIDGNSLTLPSPFFVMATQNPVERESTFPLPAAQMDRFFIKMSLGYPSQEEENQMLLRLASSIPFHTIDSVSYTHLDVYKRQACDSQRRAIWHLQSCTIRTAFQDIRSTKGQVDLCVVFQFKGTAVVVADLYIHILQGDVVGAFHGDGVVRCLSVSSDFVAGAVIPTAIINRYRLIVDVIGFFICQRIHHAVEHVKQTVENLRSNNFLFLLLRQGVVGFISRLQLLINLLLFLQAVSYTHLDVYKRQA